MKQKTFEKLLKITDEYILNNNLETKISGSENKNSFGIYQGKIVVIPNRRLICVFSPDFLNDAENLAEKYSKKLRKDYYIETYFGKDILC